MTSTQDAHREKTTAALSSVGAAIGLTSLKIIVALLTGSLGILAEAAHSGLDLVAALMTFFAVRVSDRPADASHNYGRGRAIRHGFKRSSYRCNTIGASVPPK